MTRTELDILCRPFKGANWEHVAAAAATFGTGHTVSKVCPLANTPQPKTCMRTLDGKVACTDPRLSLRIIRAHAEQADLAAA
jgi:hypothetical protein